MKTKLLFTSLLTFSFLLSPCLAQVPQGFNYQAIARDGTGNPIINTILPVRITIQSDSLGGTTFWIEEHTSVATNSFGLFSLILGKGVKQTGSAVTSFNAIDWTVTPKFIKTEINYSGWKSMGSSRLWAVPYSMVAGDLSGAVKKLAITGETSDMEEALFEVKNKNGQTIFAVYNEGIRAYVADGAAKGVKGGFSIGGFGTDKGTSQSLFVVSPDSIRAYVDTSTGKTVKGGFAIGGFGATKAKSEEYLRVTRDSTRVYLNDTENKTKKGGFAIGGFNTAKNSGNEYLSVTMDSVKVSKSLLIPRLTTSERDNLPFTPGDALIIFNTTEGCMQIFKNNVWSNIWCFNCAPAFIIQPVDKTICSGENAVFFISATGTSLSYQWYQSTDEGNTWNNLSNGGSNPAIAGANGYILTLSNVPVGRHNFKYRCVVAGSCLPDVTSNAVTLNVGSNPTVITSQPANQQLSGSCTASFSIVSPGHGVTYKWQQSTDGGSIWTNISNGGSGPVYSGATTSGLSLSNVPITSNNNKYRCVVNNLCGSEVTSTAASLTLDTSPIITVQPLNKLVYAGQNTFFDITTSGTGFIYQWQISINGGGTWLNLTNGGSNPAYTGTNAPVLSLSNVPRTFNNYKFRCVLSHPCRPDATSASATLSVPSVTDIDGNIYNTVGIGAQVWMAENLKTTKYRNGNLIGTTNPATLDISGEVTPKYQWAYDGNEINVPTYGRLYTWFAVNDSRNVCPTGWHVPTDAEWTILENYLIVNGYNYDGTTIGNKIAKAMGATTNWNPSPNEGAVGNYTDYLTYRNKSGFTGLPGGIRNYNYIPAFQNLGEAGFWWAATEYDVTDAIYRIINNYNIGFYPGDYNKKQGFSVRCLKDSGK
jgi:uncharacterized protein (TIGR02145 family)